MIILLLSICIVVLVWDLFQIKGAIAGSSGLKTITPLATEVIDSIILNRRISQRRQVPEGSLIDTDRKIIQEQTLSEAALLLSSRWGGVPVCIFLSSGATGLSHSRFEPFAESIKQSFIPFFQSGSRGIFFRGSIEDKLSWGGIVSMGYKFGASERVGNIGVLCVFSESDSKLPDGFTSTALTLEKDLVVLEQLRELSQSVAKLKRETTFAKDLVQNVSHDLRSPLHTLRLVLSSLGEGDIVDAGVRSCDVAQSVVETLLDLTRDEVNPEESRSEIVSLSEAVKEVLPMFRPISSLKEVKIEENLFQDVSVMVDKRHLRRILTNLLSNAVKYTDSGEIKVSVIEVNGFGQLVVEDTGCGMTKDELLVLGEKGARFAKDKAEGLGVGIYGTKQLVSKNNGSLEFFSEKGKGTKAVLSLPSEYSSARLVEA